MATMSLQAAYDQARNYLEANQVDQAIGVAQQILDHFPENLEAHRVLGEAYLAGRQFDQAEAAFSRVLFVDPESIPAHVGLGITFERQGNLEHAVAEFEQALEIRPDMPELRGQLLRLYTDLWGAEGATLRLSRPGLARLYAKGHMLPQAIQEFRGVIEEHPDRFDARVGLAEALWRDGQEEAVVELCEQILARRPEVLKANLLLGYILLAGGDPAGEAYWRHAQALDPYELVAHALFDTMPGIVGSELVVPAWDEAAWLARRAQADEPPDALPLAEEPDAVFAQAAPPVEPTVTAEEVLPELPPSPPVSDFDDEDDFLASLLAMDAGSAEETAFAEASGVTPFSFDEQPPLAESLAPSDVEPSTSAFAFTEDVAPVEYAAPAAEDDVDLTPFSLDDLGLSADEIAQLEAAVPAEEAAPAAAAEDDVDLTPFSLDDLGLSADELAQLEAAVPAEEAAPAAEDDVDLTPFSLDDLGLSADEIAQLEAAVPAEEAAPAAAAEDDVDLTPFSLDDL
ncbi:lipopolysaccharide assembly protein LapB, partial [Candidatus Chloroploca sp. Khr17]|uniref:tetratricopeptide repeat protein n=1 Tax=Candidatus Chloroploca sp. Khr17 TaxID=2496869 RepID=UPI00101D1B14